MIDFFRRKLKYFKLARQTSTVEFTGGMASPAEEVPDLPVSDNLQTNFITLQTIFQNSTDIVIRRFTMAASGTEAMVASLNGMSEIKLINENILGALMTERVLYHKTDQPMRKITLEYLKNSIINLNDVTEINRIEEAVSAILQGDTVFFMEGASHALIFQTRTWAQCGVQKPDTESNVRGPKEGFTETLSINISQVRRKIKDPDLCFESMKLGRRTRTEICVVYIKDIADPKIVAEVWRRLRRIDMDAVLESGYIEELIEDAPWSIFPTVGNTETPDKFAAKVLEGRVGIMVEGTPFALTVPYLFVESFQMAEDYYSRAFFTSLLRMIRFFALHLTIALPALYVAITTFHPNVLPDQLLRTIAATREGLPFPAFVEALLMGFFMRPFGRVLSICRAPSGNR